MRLGVGETRYLAQYTGGIAWAYLFTLRETIIGKMLHVSRFTTRENKLRHPMPNDWRELETMTTETYGAVQAFASCKPVENGMVVGSIVIDTGPPTAWYSTG